MVAHIGVRLHGSITRNGKQMRAHELAVRKGGVGNSTLRKLCAFARVEESYDFNIPILHLSALDFILQVPKQTTGLIHKTSKYIANHAGAILIHPFVKLHHTNEVAKRYTSRGCSVVRFYSAVEGATKALVECIDPHTLCDEGTYPLHKRESNLD